jgi:hypothetical protein
MNYSRLKTGNTIPFRRIQGFCFYTIALNLLWAYFEQLGISILFTLSCFAITGLSFLKVVLDTSTPIKLNHILCYVGFIIWSLLMIEVYGKIYSPHSVVDFLFLSMDGAAIFFVRLFVSVLPCMIFVDCMEFTIDKKAKILIFIVLATSVFFTSKAVATNPDALRARGTMEFLGQEELLIGTPGYAITYAFSLLVPVFLHKTFSETKDSRIFYGVCTFMLMYIVIVAQYATALLIAIIGIFIYMMIVSKPKARMYMILYSVAIGVFLWATDGGSDILRVLARNVEGTWALKLEDIALMLEGQNDTGSVSGRMEKYSKSTESFIKSPFLGMYWNPYGSVGGHATAIDVLGLCGIMGFIPMVTSIYGNFARMKNHTSYQTTRPAVIAVMTEFVLLIFLKNIVTSMAVFFVFYALIPLLLKAKEGENESN